MARSTYIVTELALKYERSDNESHERSLDCDRDLVTKFSTEMYRKERVAKANWESITAMDIPCISSHSCLCRLRCSSGNVLFSEKHNL